MAGLRVSELAARSGVPPSTIRFYERAGLLRPARRAANGYRLFDESAVGDLALIGQAKNAGMTLEDAGGVVAGWRDGSCRALKDRLRAHLTEQRGRVGDQLADLAAFRRKLEAALDRLAARGAGPDRCGPGCGCDSALGDSASPGDRLPGCSLGAGELADRLGQWRAVADAAESAERDGDTVRLTLDPAALPTVAALVAAEASCCPEGRFTLEVAAGQAFLTAQVPGIGAELDTQRR
ncbi:MAG: MerR family transcriptional regulator [Nocardiopsaceae bacterium]|nr:MerR family transcriptional regulator [Nocardiopsaceae bacterium]